MANSVFESKLIKPCPRCGCDVALISTYWFGIEHHPICRDCGLKPERVGDSEAEAKAVLIDCFYNYEKTIQTKSKK